MFARVLRPRVADGGRHYPEWAATAEGRVARHHCRVYTDKLPKQIFPRIGEETFLFSHLA